MYFNCRSLIPKLDELRAICQANKPDTVCIVETWLSTDIFDSELFIPNYTIVRHDRNRHGGGVALYVNDSVLCKTIVCGPADLELLIVSLCKANFKLCLGVFYRPPSSHPHIFDSLCEALLTVDTSHFSNFVLIGDFNVNLLCESSPLFSYICNLINSFTLTQVVDSPTHFTSENHCSLIDLIFVSNMYFFSNCSTIPQLSNSDHLGLLLSMKHCSGPSVSHPRRTVWRYKLADFERANDLICDLDVDELLNSSNIQQSWENLKAAFLDVMEQCIPKAVLPQKRNLPWLTKEIIQLIRRRNYFYKEARKSGSDDDFQKFKQLRNKVVAELRLAKHAFFSDLQLQDFGKS